MEWMDDWNIQSKQQLYDAMQYIDEECRKCNIGVHFKEKWGVIRYEFTFSWFYPLCKGNFGFFQCWLYPGYLWGKLYSKFGIFGKIVRRLDEFLIVVLAKLGIVAILNERRLANFFRIIKEACVKFPDAAPDIVDELAMEFDDSRAEGLVAQYGRKNETVQGV
jgi:hypothetical protein